MTDKTIDLDRRRGMEVKETDLRRLLAEVKANESALRLRQDELEAHLAVERPAVERRPESRVGQPSQFGARSLSLRRNRIVHALWKAGLVVAKLGRCIRKRPTAARSAAPRSPTCPCESFAIS